MKSGVSGAFSGEIAGTSVLFPQFHQFPSRANDAGPVAEQQFPLHIQGPKRSVVASSRKVITADIRRANEIDRGSRKKVRALKEKGTVPGGRLIFSRLFVGFHSGLFSYPDRIIVDSPI